MVIKLFSVGLRCVKCVFAGIFHFSLTPEKKTQIPDILQSSNRTKIPLSQNSKVSISGRRRVGRTSASLRNSIYNQIADGKRNE